VGEPASETEKSSSPRRRFFRGAYHQVRLHALLGGFSGRRPVSLKNWFLTNLTKLWHELLTFAIDKTHDLLKCSRFKDLTLTNSALDHGIRHRMTNAIYGSM
jgi:hypothetical protein